MLEAIEDAENRASSASSSRLSQDLSDSLPDSPQTEKPEGSDQSSRRSSESSEKRSGLKAGEQVVKKPAEKEKEREKTATPPLVPTATAQGAGAGDSATKPQQGLVSERSEKREHALSDDDLVMVDNPLTNSLTLSRVEQQLGGSTAKVDAAPEKERRVTPSTSPTPSSSEKPPMKKTKSFFVAGLLLSFCFFSPFVTFGCTLSCCLVACRGG